MLWLEIRDEQESGHFMEYTNNHITQSYKSQDLEPLFKKYNLSNAIENKCNTFHIFVSGQRVSRGPFLRCHGVQECMLLVTQRISKYPVLIERILNNTTGRSWQS